jgi:antitoxin component YwqK of YwqJK toxin-antitoxin module
MSKVIGILLIVLSSTVGAAQTVDPPCKPVPKPDWERDGLLGRVSRVRTFKTWSNKGTPELEEEASYDAIGNQITRRNLPIDPAGTIVVEFGCDSSNRIAEIRYKKVTDASFRRTVYTYDENGRDREQAEYFADGTLEGLTTYSYDHKGNQTEEISKRHVHPQHFSPMRYDVYVTTRTTYEYDNKGNKIKEFHFSPNGSLHSTWLFRYDARNLLIKELRFDKIGRLEREFVFKYDKGGWLREEWEYHNFCYEKNGDMCRGVVNSGNAWFYYLTKLTYGYDRIGNWIRQREFSMGGEKNTRRFKLEHTLSRLISYYR